MMEATEVAREAEAVARQNFGAENVVRAEAAPMVDLDGDEATAAAGEDRRDGPMARADLDHGAVADGAYRVCDGLARGVVHQKILSEPGFLHKGEFRALLAATKAGGGISAQK